MKLIETMKDIFLGEEENITDVNEKFTFGDWLRGTAAVVAACAPLGAILFIFG